MPLQNRVTPLGELVAVADRGLVYGNRGCLHDADGAIRRHHAVRRWIACRLAFKDRRRAPLVQPGRYTALFFLDEATALAAGHRPCAECRRADYDALVELWRQLRPDDHGADAIDVRLHAERLDVATGRRRLHEAVFEELPDGAFVVRDGDPWVVADGRLLRWTPGGYRDATPLLRGPARLLTPPSLVALLATDREPAVPLLHPSAAQTPSRSASQAAWAARSAS